jgi:hypothetical protein
MRIMPPLADDPERRLTLRQADQARSHFAEILDELDFVKEQLARQPDRAWAQPGVAARLRQRVGLRIELLTKGTVSVPSSDSGRARNAQQVQTAANLI